MAPPADPTPPTSEWEPVDGVDAEPPERRELTDLDLIADVTHPVRGRLLRHLKEPRTVAELAEALDVPVTRLYHHVNRLEELGLVRVVATRRVAARTERRYQVVAKSFGIATDLLRSADRTEAAQALGSLFDVGKLELQRSIETGELDAELMEQSMLSLGSIRLSADRRAELYGRLTEIIEEFRSDPEDSPGTAPTMMFLAAFPAAD